MLVLGDLEQGVVEDVLPLHQHLRAQLPLRRLVTKKGK